MLRFKEYINESKLLNNIVRDLKITDNLNNLDSFMKLYTHYVGKLHDIAKMLEKAKNNDSVSIYISLKTNIDMIYDSVVAYRSRLKRQESKNIFNDIAYEYKKCSNNVATIISNCES